MLTARRERRQKRKGEGGLISKGGEKQEGRERGRDKMPRVSVRSLVRGIVDT